MIKVENLVKRYTGFEAVKGISFEVEKGEIVGFLGPNGAGKSTTMKILTGYLPSSGGLATVAGHDLLTHSLEVRKKVGYMPENVPLYTDMRVVDFLTYRGALKGLIGKKLKNRVTEVMIKCSIADVGKGIIGNLSKGYRQRVGLADAMVHDPELLILDEPTAGLDPNQIRSVRELIKELGKSHTILLSTHILPEVEMVCNRAIIINKGKIEASDTLENLGKKVHSGVLMLEVKASADAAKEEIQKLPSVGGVDVKSSDGDWVRFECLSKPGEDVRASVDELVKKKQWALREFHYIKPTLEDIFVELTQE